MNKEALNEWMEDNTDINQIQAKVDKAMTPKEKAIELVNKFKIGDVVVEKRGTNQIVNINAYAKLFALIAVDEILEATKTKYKWGGGSPEKLVHLEEVKYDTYWLEVKQEINNL